MPKSQGKVWVYFGTGAVYDGSVDEKSLTQIYRKGNEIKSATLALTPENHIHLELITANAQRLRKEVWVYLGTSTMYPHAFNIQDLRDLKIKNGIITQGAIQLENGSTIELELISISAQRSRIEDWVYFGTSTKYPHAFNIQDLRDPKTKNGIITQGKLQLPDNRVIALELISASNQICRKEVWVYLGTSTKYPHAFNIQNLRDPKTKNGTITQGKLQLEDGSVVELELISTTAQSHRKEVWVYLGTSMTYPHAFNIQDLRDQKTKNGIITQGALQLEDGTVVEMELISANAQRMRKEVWVYLGTSTMYLHAFNIQDLRDQKTKNGIITQGKLQLEDGSVVELELISTNAQRHRKAVWVYLGTSNMYPQAFNPQDLRDPKTKNGIITQGALKLEDGSAIELELISLEKRYKRAVNCIYQTKGTPGEEETQPYKRVKQTPPDEEPTHVVDHFAALTLLLSEPVLIKTEIDAKLMQCLDGEVSNQEKNLNIVTNTNNNCNGFFEKSQAIIHAINYYLQILRNLKVAAGRLESEGGVYYRKDRLAELFSLASNGDDLGRFRSVQYNADYNSFVTFLVNAMQILTVDLDPLSHWI